MSYDFDVVWFARDKWRYRLTQIVLWLAFPAFTLIFDVTVYRPYSIIGAGIIGMGVAIVSWHLHLDRQRWRHTARRLKHMLDAKIEQQRRRLN